MSESGQESESGKLLTSEQAAERTRENIAKGGAKAEWGPPQAGSGTGSGQHSTYETDSTSRTATPMRGKNQQQALERRALEQLKKGSGK